jgi:hypothetical protein
MAVLDFPSAPTNGQTYTANGATWAYSTARGAWIKLVAAGDAGALTGATLAAGVTASSLTSVGTLVGLTVSGTAALQDNELSRAYLTDYAEKVNAIGNVTGAFNADYTLGNVATCTLTGNATMTVTNPPASGRGARLTVVVTGNGTATFAITNANYMAAGAPAVPIPSGEVRIYNLVSLVAGATWYVSYLSQS